jgi:prolyl oligopeptidase
MDSLDSQDYREFIDPNKFAEDGTTALQQGEFSEDGKYYAYMICEKGSDWGKIKIRSVETNQDLEETLVNVKFSCLEWTHDNKGFFYNQYPNSTRSDGTVIDKNEFQELFYHRVGTKQSEDIVVARFPEEPNWMGHAEVSHCGNYIIMTISHSCDPVNQMWYFDLRTTSHEIKADLPFVKVVSNFEGEYSYITNTDSVFVFKTNFEAKNYKLISIDFNNIEAGWKDLIAQKDDVLKAVRAVNNDKLLVKYLHDCKEEMYIHDLATGDFLKRVALEIGTVLELSTRKKQDYVSSILIFIKNSFSKSCSNLNFD